MSEPEVLEITQTKQDWVTTYASPTVSQALQEGLITRQHAQLLAVLSQERQATTITALLQLESLPSASELASTIESKAVPLNGVPFPTGAESGCFNCIHNSNVNAKYFDKHISPGLCTNTACADSLWRDHAQNIAETLPSKYRVIRISSTLPGIRLNDDCNNVGATQLKDCVSNCEHFGAALIGSAKDGIELCSDVCYDSVCHKEKLSVAQKEKFEQWRDSVWRKGLQRFVYEADRGVNRVIMLCMIAGGWTLPSKFGQSVFGQKVDPAAAYKLAIDSLSPDALVAGLHEMGVALVESAPIHQVRDLLKVLEVPLGKYFPMEKSFIKRLNIEEIEVVMKDLQVSDSDEIRIARTISGHAFADAIAAAINDQVLEGYLPPSLRP